MGRPASDLDDYLEWQQRLKNQKESGLSIDDFCLQEGISKSTFYRWSDRLRDGIPESIAGEKVDREMIESGNVAFVPITLKASPVEIELPNGGVVRLPLGVGELVLVEVIRVVGTMRPWKARKLKCTGYFHTYVGDLRHPLIVFDYISGHGRDGPQNFLRNFRGYLQADAAPIYDGLFNHPRRLILEVGCWMHGRRK